jgi:hypothetical protein
MTSVHCNCGGKIWSKIFKLGNFYVIKSNWLKIKKVFVTGNPLSSWYCHISFAEHRWWRRHGIYAGRTAVQRWTNCEHSHQLAT